MFLGKYKNNIIKLNGVFIMDREKEIKHLMYVKSEIIKQEKKELKRLRNELIELNKQKNKKYK